MKRMIFDSVDDIGCEAIGELEGSKLDFSFGLLRAVEKSLWGDLHVRYLTLQENSATICFLPVYFGTNVNINALLPLKLQDQYNALLDFFGPVLKTKFLIAGSLISDKGWIPCAPGYLNKKVISTMSSFVDDYARSLKVKVCMIKDIHEEFPEDLKGQLEDAGFKKLYSLPTVTIDTAFETFENYVDSLSKNAKKHARKVEKSASRIFSFEVIGDYEGLIDKIYPLFRSTYLKARYQFDEAIPRFFSECARSVNPQTELITCRQGDKIVGALINVFNQEEQLNKRIGVDYSNVDTPLIYTSLMYQGIRSAIEKGVSRVYLGQSTYVPKLRLGGKITDEYFYVKAYDPVVRLSLPWQKKYSTNFRADRVAKLAAQGVSV